jgi:hypothetical protein
MTVDKTRNADRLRERLKEKRREWQAKRRVALANDPRVQAMKLVLKARQRAAYEKAKVRRRVFVAKLKASRRERKAEQPTQSDAALTPGLRPATRPCEPFVSPTAK